MRRRMSEKSQLLGAIRSELERLSRDGHSREIMDVDSEQDPGNPNHIHLTLKTDRGEFVEVLMDFDKEEWMTVQ